MSKAIKSCTYIDGIGSSQALDTAGEIVDLKGLDISSLIGAAFNWEHNKDLPAQLVGKILEAEKIFSKEDCKNDRHLFYWNKCQIPFLYVMGRLFDDKKPSSVEVAALFKDDAEHPNESDMVGFSVEGAKIEKVGSVVTRSIARKVTITHIPANKTCIAEMLPVKKSNKDSDILELFKGEMELFKFEPTYEELLKKEELKKDVGTGGGAFIGSSLAMSEKSQKFVAQIPAYHPLHPATKKGSGMNHDWPAYYTGENKPHTHNPNEAHVFGNKGEAQKHLNQAHSKGKLNSGSYSVIPHEPFLTKAMEAGSGMAAPGALVQGAALASESLEGLNRRSKKVNSMQKKERSKWFDRADKAYQGWNDREKFRGYMKERMPHLADGEVDAIGRCLALRKDVDKEKSMSKMYTNHYKSEDIEKGEELPKYGDIKPKISHEEMIKKPRDWHSKQAGAHSTHSLIKPGKKYTESPTEQGHFKMAHLHTLYGLGESRHSDAKQKHAQLSRTIQKMGHLNKTSDIMMASEDKNKKK